MKNLPTSKKYLVLTITLVFVVIVFLTSLIWENLDSKEYRIALTNAGFQPESLEINSGDSVRFTTTLSSPFWPASDPHPIHILYSGFDPKRQIESDASWSFKFEKSGLWQYHDHLEANFRGTIVVRETNYFARVFKNINHFLTIKFRKHDEAFLRRLNTDCETKQTDRNSFFECWAGFIARVSIDFGTEESIRVLNKISKLGVLSYGECHTLSDQVGTDAYWQYVSGKEIQITPDFSVCDDGYLHHFMIEHVSHGKDIAKSQEFCDNLSLLGRNMVEQCYFGLANGLAYYHWEIFGDNADKIVEESIKICSKFKDNFQACNAAVFSGMDHLFEGIHGSTLRIDLEDPFSLCRSNVITDEFKLICYERMVPSIVFGLKYDIVKTQPLVAKIPILKSKNVSANRVGEILFEYEVSSKLDGSFEIPLEKCRLMLDLATECARGVFTSLFTDVKRNRDYYQDFSCANTMLLPNERSVCQDQSDLVLKNI